MADQRNCWTLRPKTFHVSNTWPAFIWWPLKSWGPQPLVNSRAILGTESSRFCFTLSRWVRNYTMRRRRSMTVPRFSKAKKPILFFLILSTNLHFSYEISEWVSAYRCNILKFAFLALPLFNSRGWNCVILNFQFSGPIRISSFSIFARTLFFPLFIGPIRLRENPHCGLKT